jgi:DNA-3-methyladenine glycosylase I
LLTSAEPCYAAFHDEEWGVPVHDDKYVNIINLDMILFHLVKESSVNYSITFRVLFELLVLSGALAELTWPTILNKRPIFR